MAVVNAVHDHEGEVTGVVQRTQFRSVSERGIEHGATLLLGIEGLDVLEVVLEDLEDLERDAGRVVHLGTGDEGAAACPSCGTVSTSPKGRATTRPRDLPYGDDPVRLVWHKRRWRCRERLCDRASFTESLPAVPARARLTTRLRSACGAGIAGGFSCVAAAAAYHQVSWPIAHAAFVAHVSDVLAQPLPPVEVLGIDETRRGRPRWAQDPETLRWSIVHDRWHTAVVDAAGTAGLLAHVEGRTAAAVADWVAAQPDSWRNAVTHVCIDLSASYAKAVHDALPDAVVVADRFHLVKLGNDMVTEVRQRTTREGRGRRGRARDPEWANRRRLLTAHERLSSHSFARMLNALIDQDDLGLQVLRAYIVKEELRALLALAGTHPDRELVSHRLWTFYSSAAACDLPEAHRLAETIEAWWPAVEAAITTGYSNARSEGYNRLAKHVGRNAFGFRNVENQRRRIRWTCTRQHRRVTALTHELPG